jgi:diaminopropionate ammonia-lyase
VKGWILIADTTTDVHDAATHDIMAGYGVMIMELQKQLPPESWPTHVLVQGGCGGLAAAVFGPLWALSQGARPRFIVVEPATADCLYRSGVAGQPEVSPGSLETVMAGLSVGEVSVSAWPTLKACVDGYLTIPDCAAMETMRAAADGSWGDAPFVVGDSGSAGLAGLQILADLPAAREHLALGPDSRVLVFLTEGAVDLPGYERIVGRSAASVGQGRTL